MIKFINIKKIFRIQGKELFITYSQTDGKHKDLLDFLDSKLNIEDYIIAKEKHEKEGTHFHVYLNLATRCNITNCRYLDWIGHHPKIEICKSSSKVIRYTKKDGNYITNLSIQVYSRSRNLAKEGKWREAINLIIEEAPKEFIKFGDKIELNLKKIAIYAQKTQKTNKYKKDNFNYPDIINKWNRDKQVLILSGGAGYGKTQFAKSLFKNALLVRHKDKLKKFSPIEYDGIIFDDWSMAHWPRESCIHLIDTEEDTDIDVKCGMVTIPAGTPRVFTTNRKPHEIFNTYDKAIRRRCLSVIISKDMRRKRNIILCNVIK